MPSLEEALYFSPAIYRRVLMIIMTRFLLLTLLILPGLALAQVAAPPAPVVEAAPDPGDLSLPTPPLVPPTKGVPILPPVELPAPPATSTVAPVAATEQPLTADEAARIALQLQPDVTIANADIVAAQGQTQQARAALRPSLGFSAGYTQQESLNASTGTGGNTGGGTDPFSNNSSSGLRASATVRQLLFDFKRTRDAVRASAARERAANANLTRVQSDLVLQVKQAFYTFVQNSRLVNVNEANVKNRQDQLALAQARLNVGLGAPPDVVRALTAVADAVFNLESARNSASLSRVNLALLMGIDARTPLQTADSSEPIIATDDVNGLVNQALAQRPEVAQAQATLDAAGFGVSIARKSNAPSIGVSGSLASRGDNLSLNRSSVRATLDFSWTPFDGGLSRGLVKEAQANASIAQSELNRARQNIVSDVSQAYLNLRTAEQSVVTADAQVANAEESVRLAEGRYRAGVGTFIEVTDAQAALLTARTNRVNAVANVDKARAALSRAIGAALPTMP